MARKLRVTADGKRTARVPWCMRTRSKSRVESQRGVSGGAGHFNDLRLEVAAGAFDMRHQSVAGSFEAVDHDGCRRCSSIRLPRATERIGDVLEAHNGG